MTNFRQLHLTFAGQIETVPTASMLPTQGVVEGAIRWIEDTNTLAFWDGSAWGGPTFDSLTVNNLTVNNLAYVNANVVEIGDNIITLNSDVVGTPTEDAGIEINRGASPNAYILWDETEEVWKAGVAGDMGRFPSTAPAFMFTRSGNITPGTWLLNGAVPSNVAGIPVAIPAAKIERIMVDNAAQNTFSIGLYEHDHVSYTQLGTVSVTADYGDEYLTNLPITVGKKLAVKLETGSASNVTVSLQIKG